MASAGQRGSPRSGVIWALVGVVVVLIIVAGIGWGLYATKKTSSISNAEMKDVIEALAYSHWDAIGIENITMVMSQYSSNAVLNWWIKYSPYDTAYNAALNGTYRGTTAIQAVWTKFLQDDVVYFWMNKVNVTVSSSSASVTAFAWYLLSNNTASGKVNQSASVSSQLFTLIMPYQLDYSYIGGTWYLTSEWWGTPNHQGSVFPGAYGLKNI